MTREIARKSAKKENQNLRNKMGKQYFVTVIPRGKKHTR